jgi:hypothetical protein
MVRLRLQLDVAFQRQAVRLAALLPLLVGDVELAAKVLGDRPDADALLVVAAKIAALDFLLEVLADPAHLVHSLQRPGPIARAYDACHRRWAL